MGNHSYRKYFFRGGGKQRLTGKGEKEKEDHVKEDGGTHRRKEQESEH